MGRSSKRKSERQPLLEIHESIEDFQEGNNNMKYCFPENMYKRVMDKFLCCPREIGEKSLSQKRNGINLSQILTKYSFLCKFADGLRGKIFSTFRLKFRKFFMHNISAFEYLKMVPLDNTFILFPFNHCLSTKNNEPVEYTKVSLSHAGKLTKFFASDKNSPRRRYLFYYL